jgi:hypothetical protein
MIRISVRSLTRVIALLTLVPAAQSQASPQDKSLGDVAREQQELRKRQKKAAPSNVYTETGVASDHDTPDNGGANSSSCSDSDKSVDAKACKPSVAESKPAEVQDGPSPRSVRSLLDRAPDTKPDMIVVPAGTEIKVDIVEGKVIVPVRVGFATPIPAQSKVAVQVNPVYYYTGYGNYGTGPVAFIENAVLTAVTVRGVTYAVQASAVQLDTMGAVRGTMAGSSSRDAVFVLSAPVAIER